MPDVGKSSREGVVRMGDGGKGRGGMSREGGMWPGQGRGAELRALGQVRTSGFLLSREDEVGAGSQSAAGPAPFYKAMLSVAVILNRKEYENLPKFRRSISNSYHLLH